MARGNQRDKAREKNQKESAAQKKKNTPFILPQDDNSMSWLRGFLQRKTSAAVSHASNKLLLKWKSCHGMG
ncbi:MAG: hypothetical protein L6R37_004421 [Teloschistes peruensis]|nr:MAG: hypothetical protein L6R37_004421 [Teloschistes peruensis]